MRARVVSLCTVAVLLACAASASAQVHQGLNELGVRGKIDRGRYSDEPKDLTFLTLTGFWGRFITDRIDAGPNLVLDKLQGEDATLGVGGFVGYHFGDTNRKMIPWIEGQVGKGFGDPVADSWNLGITGGVKIFLGEGTGVMTVGPFYRRFMWDKDKRGFSVENQFGFSIGVAAYFP